MLNWILRHRKSPLCHRNWFAQDPIVELSQETNDRIPVENFVIYDNNFIGL